MGEDRALVSGVFKDVRRTVAEALLPLSSVTSDRTVTLGHFLVFIKWDNNSFFFLAPWKFFLEYS